MGIVPPPSYPFWALSEGGKDSYIDSLWAAEAALFAFRDFVQRAPDCRQKVSLYVTLSR
jgi:hypothetical protein